MKIPQISMLVSLALRARLAEGNEGPVTRPISIYQPRPRFRASHGRVVVEGIIDQDECVRQTRIVESKTTDRYLDAMAEEEKSPAQGTEGPPPR
jgi:hypothetical protein